MKAFLMAVALAAGLGASALAATDPQPAAAPKQACFQARDWKGWKARDDKTMYLRVGLKDVYEVGFASGCRRMQDIGAQLITVFHGGTNVCGPLDLDIKVTDSSGTPPVACIASSVRKLSAAEAKAIPKKLQP
jgi:hypothetical protein